MTPPRERPDDWRDGRSAGHPRQAHRVVRDHTASADVTSAAALGDLRALEAATADLHSDSEATAAAALLHRARMAALPENARGTDLVAAVVLLSCLPQTAPELAPPGVRNSMKRHPSPRLIDGEADSGGPGGDNHVE
jgi:hypothetical protein